MCCNRLDITLFITVISFSLLLPTMIGCSYLLLALFHMFNIDFIFFTFHIFPFPIWAISLHIDPQYITKAIPSIIAKPAVLARETYVFLPRYYYIVYSFIFIIIMFVPLAKRQGITICLFILFIY